MTDMQRRSFLRTAAMAGAGLLLASHDRVLGGEAHSSSDDLQIALIGTGAQGQVLMNACLKIPNIRFRAVVDIWEAYNLRRAHRMLQKFGHTANAYIDYREMLAKEKGLDAVLIASPDFWHAEHTVECLKAGLHVYCEKEMSNTLEGARRMVQAARQTKKLLQIGHQRRSNPRYIHCYKKLITDAKLLGRMTAINGQWNRSVQQDNGWPKDAVIPPAVLQRYGFKSMQQFRNWRWFKGMGGGPIVDLGSHQIDIFSWFLNTNPHSIVASGGTDYYDKATHEWYDTVLATLEYNTPTGKVRAFYQTLSTNSNQGYFETFMGDQGTLAISESGGRGGVYREPAAPEWEKWVSMGYLKAPAPEPKKAASSAVLDVRETIAPPAHEIPVKFDDPYHKPHLENFFNAVRGKEPLNCPAEIGYETAVTVLRINEAIERGTKLTLEPAAFRI
jgi:predicted dehydrogenase